MKPVPPICKYDWRVDRWTCSVCGTVVIPREGEGPPRRPPNSPCTGKRRLLDRRRCARPTPHPRAAVRLDPPGAGCRPSPPIIPESGPGSHLKDVIRETIGETPLCGGCLCWLAQMNAWGVAGCREHLDEIVGRLFKMVRHFDWGKKSPPLKARAARAASYVPVAAAAVRARCRAMADEAIRRAEAEER